MGSEKARRGGRALGLGLAAVLGSTCWLGACALGGLLAHGCGHPETVPLERRIERLEAGYGALGAAAGDVLAELEAARGELEARGVGVKPRGPTAE
jgi:hypothetical protein